MIENTRFLIFGLLGVLALGWLLGNWVNSGQKLEGPMTGIVQVLEFKKAMVNGIRYLFNCRKS